MNTRKKYNKIAMLGTAVLTSLTLTTGIVQEVYAGQSQTTDSKETNLYVGNIDVQFNGKQINSGYVTVDGGEPVFLAVHVSTFGAGNIPSNATVNVEMNGVTVAAPIDSNGDAYTGLPLSVEKNTTYLVHVSTSGFSGDAPQTITFVGSDKGYVDDILPPVESTEDTSTCETTTEESTETTTTETTTETSTAPSESTTEDSDTEVTHPSGGVEYPNGKSDLTEDEQNKVLEDYANEETPVVESETVETSERVTHSSVQSPTEQTETSLESSSDDVKIEESSDKVEETKVDELPKTGSENMGVLRVVGFFLLGFALSILWNNRKGGK